jgi:hypothetical protein
MKIENILKKLWFTIIWWYPIVWVMVTLVMIVAINFTDDRIVPFSFNPSSEGLTLLVSVFSVPLYFFAAGIPIYGIILTIKRIDQTKKQLDEVQKQYEQSKKNAVENTFFKLLEIHMQFVDRLRYNSGSGWREGKRVFHELHADLYGRFHNFQCNNIDRFCSVVDGFVRHHAENNSIYLKQYFGSIEGIIRHIDENTHLINLPTYVNVLKSQFSKYELLFLLYYAILPGNETLLELVKKYDLLSDINQGETLSQPDRFNTWDFFSQSQ